MLRKFILPLSIACLSMLSFSCGNTESSTVEDNQENVKTNVRIVSLSGPVSEILAALGLESNIAGVDVTSVYPESLQALPKVGHSHNLNVEGIVSLQPNIVVSLEERGLNPEQAEQLKQAGVHVLILKQEYTIDGTKKLINQIAEQFGKQKEAEQLIANIDANLQTLPTYEHKPKVLFVYARGAGTLQVAGDHTPFAEMIKLSGGVNAMEGQFENFRPLTAEAVVSSNPDYILLFDSGLESLDGPTGLLKVPGVAQTNAGKNKQFVVMESQLLSGFGPRVVEAVKTLGAELHKQ